MRAWLGPAAMLGLGLVAGFAGRQALVPAEAEEGDAGRATAGVSQAGQAGASVGPATVRSQASLEEILADRSGQQHGRLALWLLDADSSRMEAMFRAMLKEEKVGSRNMVLLLEHWAKLDHKSALRVAKGTGWALEAWWAWGRVDPEQALRAALEKRRGYDTYVLHGIGQVDPDLALRLARKYPRAWTDFSIGGIAWGLGRRDAREAIEFSHRYGREGGEYFKRWARSDPEAMLEWCRRNELGPGLSSGATTGLEILVQEHPGRINEFMESLPTGRLRRELLKSAVRELARQDAERARLLADREKGFARTALYAILGTEIVDSDLEQSQELFREAIALTERSRQGGMGNPKISIEKWIDELARVDPAGTIALLRESGEAGFKYRELSVVDDWLERDEVAVAEWLRDEPASDMRDRAVCKLVRRLRRWEGEDFPSALEWGATVANEKAREQTLLPVMGQWVSERGPGELEAYLESGEAPVVVRETWEARETVQQP